MENDVKGGSDTPLNRRKVGRPRVRIAAAEVRALRNQGESWRRIGRALGIGKTTAARLFVGGDPDCVPKSFGGPPILLDERL